MSNQTINFLTIPISALTLSEFIQRVDQSIQTKTKLHASSLDAATVVNILHDKESYTAILASDVITADGFYVVLASRFLGMPLPGQVLGVDIQKSCVELAHQKGYKIFFLGAKQEVLDNLVKYYSEQYSPQIIAGARNGYFSLKDEPEIVEQINRSGADMLLLGISSPLKEMFLFRNKNKLNVSFFSGVGGVFDIVGGKTKRAPRWVVKIRLEWFYRFLLEPRRMANRVFKLYPLYFFCKSLLFILNINIMFVY
jgi:N-acetylglucosaminyldiphosphoundecaprenol N-acetyl-beta-D-mannosaminyltransferase